MADNTHSTFADDASDATAAQPQATTPPPASVSINPVGFDDTGVAGDDLTSDPAVTFSGTVQNASKVEVYAGSTDLGAATLASDGTWSLATKLADGAYATFSAVATDEATSATVSASVTTPLTVDTAPPTVTVDRTTAGFRSGETAVLSGTASEANGVAGVEIFNGKTDLGAATVNADGTWTFKHTFGAGDHAKLTAVATAASGTTASAAAPYELVTGVAGQPYRALEYDYAADGSYGYTEYSNLGKPLVVATNNGDGTHTVTANANGQVLYSAGNDTLTGGGSSETFVYLPGSGRDVVTDFQAAGQGHDVLDLSNTHLNTLAQVLNSTTVSGGTATIHVNRQDTITLDGVSRADLKAHRSDFLFA